MIEVSADLSNYFHSHVCLIFLSPKHIKFVVCSPVTHRYMLIHQSFLSLGLPVHEMTFMIYLSS